MLDMTGLDDGLPVTRHLHTRVSEHLGISPVTIFVMKDLPGVLAENFVLLTFPNFLSKALFARRLMLRVKLMDAKRFFSLIFQHPTISFCATLITNL